MEAFFKVMGIVYLLVIAVQIQCYLSYTKKAAKQQESLDHGFGYSTAEEKA